MKLKTHDSVLEEIRQYCVIVADRNGSLFTYTDYDFDDTCLIFNFGLHWLQIRCIIGERGGIYRINGNNAVRTPYKVFMKFIDDSVCDWKGHIFESMGT